MNIFKQRGLPMNSHKNTNNNNKITTSNWSYLMLKIITMIVKCLVIMIMMSNYHNLKKINKIKLQLNSQRFRKNRNLLQMTKSKRIISKNKVIMKTIMKNYHNLKKIKRTSQQLMGLKFKKTRNLIQKTKFNKKINLIKNQMMNTMTIIQKNRKKK